MSWRLSRALGLGVNPGANVMRRRPASSRSPVTFTLSNSPGLEPKRSRSMAPASADPPPGGTPTWRREPLIWRAPGAVSSPGAMAPEVVTVGALIVPSPTMVPRDRTLIPTKEASEAPLIRRTVALPSPPTAMDWVSSVQEEAAPSMTISDDEPGSRATTSWLVVSVRSCASSEMVSVALPAPPMTKSCWAEIQREPGPSMVTVAEASGPSARVVDSRIVVVSRPPPEVISTAASPRRPTRMRSAGASSVSSEPAWSMRSCAPLGASRARSSSPPTATSAPARTQHWASDAWSPTMSWRAMSSPAAPPSMVRRARGLIDALVRLGPTTTSSAVANVWRSWELMRRRRASSVARPPTVSPPPVGKAPSPRARAWPLRFSVTSSVRARSVRIGWGDGRMMEKTPAVVPARTLSMAAVSPGPGARPSCQLAGSARLPPLGLVQTRAPARRPKIT
jgi:hypothetical protein